ncbi:MAG: hypothetical protein JNK67_11560 [Alphaproteobacteria bacterium]|nr:hypothetical protein [Alphaproteobacteria bacterium]
MTARNSLIASLAALGTLAAASIAQAVPVYGTAADLAGSRTLVGGTGVGTTPNGLQGFVNGDSDVANISWTITAFNATTYRYTYTFSSSAQQTISHLILDLSTNCTSVGSCFSSFSYNGVAMADAQLVFGTYAGGPSNPNLDGSIQGVKFNRPESAAGTSEFTISFLSDRVAVWGDFYTKGGNGTSNGFSIYNTGVNEHGTSESIYDYIAVPDTVTACTAPGGCTGGAPDPSGDPVPVPGMAGLFALGVAGLIGVRRRRG